MKERREEPRDMGEGLPLAGGGGGESDGRRPELGSRLLGSNPKVDLAPGETAAPRTTSGLRCYPVWPRNLAPEGTLWTN